VRDLTRIKMKDKVRAGKGRGKATNRSRGNYGGALVGMKISADEESRKKREKACDYYTNYAWKHQRVLKGRKRRRSRRERSNLD